MSKQSASAPAPATNAPTDTETPSQRQSNWRNVFRVIAAMLFLALLVLGIIWMARNLVSIPSSSGPGFGRTLNVGDLGYAESFNPLFIGAWGRTLGCPACRGRT